MVADNSASGRDPSGRGSPWRATKQEARLISGGLIRLRMFLILESWSSISFERRDLLSRRWSLAMQSARSDLLQLAISSMLEVLESTCSILSVLFWMVASMEEARVAFSSADFWSSEMTFESSLTRFAAPSATCSSFWLVTRLRAFLSLSLVMVEKGFSLKSQKSSEIGIFLMTHSHPTCEIALTCGVGGTAVWELLSEQQRRPDWPKRWKGTRGV